MSAPAESNDNTICRVWGDFELPTKELPEEIEVIFKLNSVNDGPVKANKILVQNKVVAHINELGILTYKGVPYVELLRTTSLTPNTTLWSVTSKQLKFSEVTFSLSAATFDLASLIV
jgi:hypothetical protein